MSSTPYVPTLYVPRAVAEAVASYLIYMSEEASFASIYALACAADCDELSDILVDQLELEHDVIVYKPDEELQFTRLGLFSDNFVHLLSGKSVATLGPKTHAKLDTEFSQFYGFFPEFSVGLALFSREFLVEDTAARFTNHLPLDARQPDQKELFLLPPGRILEEEPASGFFCPTINQGTAS